MPRPIGFASFASNQTNSDMLAADGEHSRVPKCSTLTTMDARR